MSLKKIRLELARDKEHPEGSNRHGYEFVGPLDETGHLVRKPGGHWAFHYDINGDADDDEGGYRLGNHKFALGEYVSIREHEDEVMRAFRVVRVEELPE
jgi:hypothetical protein